jgi:hypothetical protein
MQYNVARRDARLPAVLFSPVDRLLSGPTWTKVIAGLGSLVEFAYHDAFFGALAFAIVAGAFDRRMGIKVAQLTEGTKVDPIAVKRDALEKVSGVFLLVVIRSFEHYLYLQNVAPNTHGIAATAGAIGLFTAYVRSILQHREELGAKPWPIIGAVIDWIQQLGASRVPPVPPAPGAKS